MPLLSLPHAFHYSILKGREVCAPRLKAFRNTCGRAGMVMLQNGTTAEYISTFLTQLIPTLIYEHFHARKLSEFHLHPSYPLKKKQKKPLLLKLIVPSIPARIPRSHPWLWKALSKKKRKKNYLHAQVSVFWKHESFLDWQSAVWGPSSLHSSHLHRIASNDNHRYVIMARAAERGCCGTCFRQCVL